MPGGGNIAGIAVNSPHPAASKLFLNWLIQADTQKALSKAFGTTPMNKTTESETEHPDMVVQFYGKSYSMEMKKEYVSQVMMR